MSYLDTVRARDDSICTLHVDDEADVLDVASTALKRELDELTVISATSADEGLRLFGEREVDCIVSDYDMPGKDGLQFLDAVRDTNPDFPFVLFTGRGSEEIASEAISRGVTDYLKKEPGLQTFTVLANRIEHAVDRYRSRRMLEFREQSLARSQRIANMGSWEWDVANDQLFWSDQVYRIFGTDPDEFDATYESFLELVHPDDRESVRLAVETALDGREEYDVTHRIVRNGREKRWVEEQAEVIRDGDGAAVALVGTVQDITERVRQRTELSAFRQAVEHAGHSIYWTDTDGTIQYVNPAFEEMTGYDWSEAVGENPRILKSGEHSEGFYANLWETITSGEVWRSRVVNRRKGGDRYTVEQTIAPIETRGGETKGFVAVNAEIPGESEGSPESGAGAREEGSERVEGESRSVRLPGESISQPDR